MKYWLFITNEENWKVILGSKVYGVRPLYKSKYESLNIGDKIVMYIKGAKIGGTFLIKDKHYSTKTVFKGHDYEHRVKLEKGIIPKEPLNLDKKMIEKLQFIRNKYNWGSHLMGKAILEIPDIDFKLFEGRLKNDRN